MSSKSAILESLREIVEKFDNAETITNFAIVESEVTTLSKFLNVQVNKEDWCFVKFRASDNLVNRSIRKWHVNVLNSMSRSYKNAVLLTDHNWDSIDNCLGVIYRAETVVENNLSSNALQVPGYEEINQKIIDREGYIQVVYYAAIPKTVENQGVVSKIENKILRNCSTGGRLSKMRLLCPNCSSDKGREVSFLETDKNDDFICPHLIPDSYTNAYDDNPYAEYSADYLELDGNYEGYELSIVSIPNLPNTGIID